MQNVCSDNKSCSDVIWQNFLTCCSQIFCFFGYLNYSKQLTLVSVCVKHAGAKIIMCGGNLNHLASYHDLWLTCTFSDRDINWWNGWKRKFEKLFVRSTFGKHSIVKCAFPAEFFSAHLRTNLLQTCYKFWICNRVPSPDSLYIKLITFF